MLSFQIQKNSVEFVHLSRRYGSFRGEDPVLAPYLTLEALLAALERSGGADVEIRSRVLCAVLTRHRAAPGPLGSAIVLHAFRGMLGRLSKGLVGVERDDADALVASALVEALQRVRPARDPARIAMYVRQETRRVVFAALERDGRARWYESDDDEEEEAYVAEPSSDGRAGAPDDWSPDDDAPGAFGASTPRSRGVDLDRLPDPESLVPIEERIDMRRPSASRVSDEDLLRAHAIRGGLRRLTSCLFEDASAREREHVYRQLLGRAQRLVARRK
ncbi:MAG: hypothetical protein ACRELB_20990 [Polyangiaceae bacterium]